MCGHRIPPSGNAGARSIGYYCATKFAVTTLTEALRQELQAANLNIRVAVRPNIFLPSYFSIVLIECDTQ